MLIKISIFFFFALNVAHAFTCKDLLFSSPDVEEVLAAVRKSHPDLPESRLTAAKETLELLDDLPPELRDNFFSDLDSLLKNTQLSETEFKEALLDLAAQTDTRVSNFRAVQPTLPRQRALEVPSKQSLNDLLETKSPIKILPDVEYEVELLRPSDHLKGKFVVKFNSEAAEFLNNPSANYSAREWLKAISMGEARASGQSGIKKLSGPWTEAYSHEVKLQVSSQKYRLGARVSGRTIQIIKPFVAH